LTRVQNLDDDLTALRLAYDEPPASPAPKSPLSRQRRMPMHNPRQSKPRLACPPCRPWRSTPCLPDQPKAIPW